MQDIYAQEALSQIPRLLSSQDRNSFSPTYGCFNREFWLNRTRDFPDAIAQFGTLSLALVWAYKFPQGEQYYKNLQIKNWVLAGIEYWIKIQHRDGSYDEFYPNERGWAGPTGFLLYAMLRSYEVLENEFPKELTVRFFTAVKKSAWFLATREEEGVLANHHAMALLPIYQAYRHLQKSDPGFSEKLLKKFEKRLNVFFGYCYEEGWCLEYDGADPGYLSATVSFLSKMQKYIPASPNSENRSEWSEKIQTVIDKAIDFSSYFLYPNGSYGGTLGSRQTLHFYAHGYELQARHNPLALSCAEFALRALSENKLVPPGIQNERYFVYRIPEYLEAYIDYTERHDNLPPLPHQKKSFEKYFEQSKILIKNIDSHYMLVNFAKGGIIKIFSKHKKNLAFADDGILAKLSSGKILSSHWVGKEYEIENLERYWRVRGNLHKLSFSNFTPLTMMGFRIFMLLAGWDARVANKIKGVIRNIIVTGSTKSQISFERTFSFNTDTITINNIISSKGRVSMLRVSGQFAPRYVPQSRYFQKEELDDTYWLAPKEALDMLNENKRIILREIYNTKNSQAVFEVEK